jgi:DNA repair protein RadC
MGFLSGLVNKIFKKKEDEKEEKKVYPGRKATMEKLYPGRKKPLTPSDFSLNLNINTGTANSTPETGRLFIPGKPVGPIGDTISAQKGAPFKQPVETPEIRAFNERLKPDAYKTWAEGRTEKDIENRRTIAQATQGETQRDLKTGMAGLKYGGYKALEWVLSDKFKPYLSDKADKQAELIQIVATEDQDFKNVLTSGAASAALFFIPGFGIARGTSALARITPKLARLIGLSVSTGLESMVEAGSVYGEVQQLAGDDQEASNAAFNTLLANALIISLTNKYGAFSDTAKTNLRRTAFSSLMEGGQELSQEVIQNYQTGQALFEGAGMSTLAGVILGGGMGYAGGKMTVIPNMRPEQIKKEIERVYGKPGGDESLAGMVRDKLAESGNYPGRAKSADDITSQISKAKAEGKSFEEGVRVQGKINEKMPLNKTVETRGFNITKTEPLMGKSFNEYDIVFNKKNGQKFARISKENTNKIAENPYIDNFTVHFDAISVGAKTKGYKTFDAAVKAVNNMANKMDIGGQNRLSVAEIMSGNIKKTEKIDYLEISGGTKSQLKALWDEADSGMVRDGITDFNAEALAVAKRFTPAERQVMEDFADVVNGNKKLSKEEKLDLFEKAQDVANSFRLQEATAGDKKLASKFADLLEEQRNEYGEIVKNIYTSQDRAGSYGQIKEANSKYYDKIQDAKGGGYNSGMFNSPVKVKFKKQGTFVFANEKISSPADVAYAFKQLKNEAVEHFYAVGLKNNKPVSVELISMGTLNASLVHPREVTALLSAKNVDGVYYIHNHPSGRIEPSEADIELSKRLKEVHGELGIEYKGHVIIDTDKFGFIGRDLDYEAIKHIEAAKNPKKVSAYKKYLEWVEGSQVADGVAKKEVDIMAARDIYEIYKGIGLDDKNILVIFLGARNNVITTQVIPKNKATYKMILEHALEYPTASVAIAGEKLGNFLADMDLSGKMKKAGIEVIDMVEADLKKGDWVADRRGYFSEVQEKKGKYVSGEEQLKQREQAKLDREDAILRKQALSFGDPDLDGQYESFKKLLTPGKLDEVADVDQLKKAVKASPEEIDNILYSQDKTVDEVFEMFKERRFMEIVPLPQVPPETKAVVAAKARAQVKSAKEILDRRRNFIRAAQKQFGLSDADVKSINKKDIRLMNTFEFKNFINDFRVKAEKLAERKQAQNELISQIQEKDLNIEPLRLAMKYPPIGQMSVQQLRDFNELLKPYMVGDVFLSQRKLETINRTELEGIRTYREATERLAKKLGVKASDLRTIRVSELDRFRGDVGLAKLNPFYKMMVEETAKLQMIRAAEFLEIETKVNKLAAKIGNRFSLIPKQRNIVRYFETDNKASVQLSPAEMELVKYMQEEWSKARDYLIKMEMLKKGINNENYFTHIRRGVLEAVSEDGVIGAAKEVYKAYKQDELVFNILDDQTGEIMALDKFFRFTIRRIGGLEPTKNVVQAFRVYMRTFKKKQALDEIVPLIDIYANSLTPKGTTQKGVLLHSNMIRFTKEWLNTKKGRVVTAFVKQGGNIDLFIRGLKNMTYLLDLGLNIPVTIATQVGEQVITYKLLGKAGYLKSKALALTPKGKRITNKYRNFIGKNPWLELLEPAIGIEKRLSSAIFASFQDANVRRTRNFLLGSLTKEEWANETISPERLTLLRTEMGHYGMITEAKSIFGATSVGGMWTQYKTWALPIFRSEMESIINLRKIFNKPGLGKEEGQRALLNLYRTLELVVIVSMVRGLIGEDDDDSMLAQIKNSAYLEMSTIWQALDPKLFLSSGRISSFLNDLGNNISMLINWRNMKALSLMNMRKAT